MSFPFTFNNFLPINIKGSNAVTGTFGGVSILNNGKTELRSDTTITRLGINKNVSGSYEMDVSGNVAISTAITVPRITSTYGVSATLLTTVSNTMSVDASGVFSFTATNPEATFQSFKTLFNGGGLTISQVNWSSIVAMPINAIWTFYIQNNTSGLITVKNSVVSNTAGTFLHAEYANDVIIPNGFNIGIIKLQKIESVEAFIYATPTSNSAGGTIPFTLPTNATFGNLTVSNGFTVGASGAGLFDSSVNMFGEEINVNGGVANGVFRVGNDQLYMGLYDEVFSINNNGEFNVDTMTTNIITFGQFGINAGSNTGTIRMGNDISMNLVDHTMTNNATTTFSILPLCSAVPTTGNQLINKTFSDATYVDLTNNETIGGIKTFTSLPQSSATPTTSTQLITKAYGDSTYGGGGALLSSNNSWSGINTFNNNLTMGTSGYFLPYYPLTNTTLRIGLNVLQNSTALSVNTIAIGNNALQGTTNVAYDNKFIRNIVIGENGLASTIYGTTNTPNNDNVCIGYNVAKGHNLNTTDNVIIGSQCLAGLGAGGTNDSVVIGAKIGVNNGGHTFSVIIGAKNFPSTAVNNSTVVGYGNFANSTLSFANTLIIYGDGNMVNCGLFNRTICIGSVSLLNFNSAYSAIVIGCETLQGLTTAAGFVSAFGSFISTSNPSLSNTTIIGTFSETGLNNTCYIGGNQSGVYQDLLPANKNKLLTNQTVATNQTLTFESGEHVNITSNAVTTITLPVSIATKNIGTRFILFKNYTTAVSITISSGSDGIRLADNSVANTYTWAATEQYITLVCVSTTSPMWVIINTQAPSSISLSANNTWSGVNTYTAGSNYFGNLSVSSAFSVGNSGALTTETDIFSTNTFINYGLNLGNFVVGNNELIINNATHATSIASTDVQFSATAGFVQFFGSTLQQKPSSIQLGASATPYLPYKTFPSTITSASINWDTTPPAQFTKYILFSNGGSGTVAITLPQISNSAVFEGMEFVFRRTNTAAGATTTSILAVARGGTTDLIYLNGSNGTGTNTAVLASGAYYGKIVCVQKAGGRWAYFPS